MVTFIFLNQISFPSRFGTYTVHSLDRRAVVNNNSDRTRTAAHPESGRRRLIVGFLTGRRPRAIYARIHTNNDGVKVEVSS